MRRTGKFADYKRAFAVSMGVLLLAASAWAQGMAEPAPPPSPPANMRPPELKDVAIWQHLNDQIPPDLAFRDETGRAVRLGDYFGKRPIILTLNYYRCTMLCGEELAGLSSALKVVKFDLGKDFEVVTVSFDPHDTPEIASAKKTEYIHRYGRPGAGGWHFLTGTQPVIDALTKAAGFQYQYDPRSDQYAHATAIMVLTPEGRISKYFYGVEYAPKDLRLALVQASDHKIGSVVDDVLLYCYHYNPETGKYGAIVTRVLRLAGLATILALGMFWLVMYRHGSHAHS